MEIFVGQSAKDKKRFFSLMGEYFASKEIRKWLGMPMSDSHEHYWVVLGKGDQVWAFAAITAPNGVGVSHLVHAVVLPDYRHKGLHKALIEKRIAMSKDLKAKLLRSTTTAESRPHLEAAGFRYVLNKGKYAVMEMKL